MNEPFLEKNVHEKKCDEIWDKRITKMLDVFKREYEKL